MGPTCTVYSKEIPCYSDCSKNDRMISHDLKKYRWMAMHMWGVVDAECDDAAFPAESMTKSEYICKVKIVTVQ